MSRTILIALCSLALLTATLAAPGTPTAQAQAESGLSLIAEFQVPNSTNVKYPHVVAYGSQVHVSGNANRSTAYVWTKAVAANSFPASFELGAAGGQPDYSSTSVSRGSDGSIYAAWVNQDSNNIYMRQRSTAGSWGPQRLIHRGGGFCCVNPEVAVSSTGQIFVAWRDPDRPARFSTSSDGGANWSGARNVSDDVAFGSQLGLAAGPNGAMAITFTAGAGANLQIFVGLWNGSSFNVQRITSQGADYADSSVSFGPDGKVYAAYRGIAESGGNSGVFYTERTSTGSWPRSRLVSGTVFGTVSVNADEGGSLHFTWLAQPSGGTRPHYAFKPGSGEIKGPLASNSGTLFNARAFGSVADASYNHAVSEDFTGSGLRTRYTLFKSNVIAFGGEPVIGDGTARTRTSAGNTVQVIFNNVVGSPNQIRYAWNRAPTNVDPWLPFATTMSIPVPQEIIDSAVCGQSTLYTQLRNTSTNQMEAQPRAVSVLVDGKVAATVTIDNALNHSTSGTAVLANIPGAPGGDPYYTRVPLVYLSVTPQGDCSGLTSLGVGATASSVENTYPLSATGFQGIVPLPNLANLTSGKAPFYVHITDGVGNVGIYPFEIIIDEDKPVLNTQSPGTSLAVADSRGDILQDITFTNINVRDATYDPDDADPNRRFWGVWLANSPEPLDAPLSAGLKWTVLKAPASVAELNTAAGGTDYKVTIQDWSLATGLSSAQQTPGDYFIYVRFLDAAGNVTDDYMTVRVESSNMTRLKLQLPAIVR